MPAIGHGLMTNPECLLMDEPSEGLAPMIIQHLWEVIRQLKHAGLSILLVEQNVSLSLQLVDYVHVISKGQIVHSCVPRTSGLMKRSKRGIWGFRREVHLILRLQ
jgi:branched-chain amino acid transport system ATP-binding protein